MELSVPVQEFTHGTRNWRSSCTVSDIMSDWYLIGTVTVGPWTVQ
jgi:hypothetical protein